MHLQAQRLHQIDDPKVLYMIGRARRDIVISKLAVRKSAEPVVVGSGGGASASLPARGGVEDCVRDRGKGGVRLANRIGGVKDLENDSWGDVGNDVGNDLGNDLRNDLGGVGCRRRA